jgi:transcriptional regulator with XRE-family HTH domain
MRTSLKRTTVAVLRAILSSESERTNYQKVSAADFAELVGCSTATINSLEVGRLTLSESLGQKIAHATGVSLAWLLEGDVTVPPVARDGEPYTAEVFARWQHERLGFDQVSSGEVREIALTLACRLFAVLHSANESRKLHPALNRTMQFIRTMAEEFGHTPGIFDLLHVDARYADALQVLLSDDLTGARTLAIAESWYRCAKKRADCFQSVVTNKPTSKRAKEAKPSKGPLTPLAKKRTPRS